jgi:ATP-binding cassette subfamily F protein uup
MALLSLREVSVTLGGHKVLDAASLQIERGERVCLLGRNGAGKSTMMKLLSGALTPDSGEVIGQKGARVALLTQEVPPETKGRVFDIVADGLSDDGAPHPTNTEDETHRVEAVLSRLNLDAQSDFAILSGGLKRRVLLARALVCDPDILLLDEPTNHLDIESITWLEDFLPRYVKTLLFVSHDRVFTSRLATRIVEVDRGKLSSWECDYATYLVRKSDAMAAEAKQSALFDKRLQEEEAWSRRGVEARRTKSQARLRDLQKMRDERAARRNVAGSVQLRAQEAGKSGHLVVEAEGAAYSYDETPIVRDFSTLVVRGDRVGFIGANGAGKTTLLRLLLGQIAAQSGKIKLGTRLEIAYFDQMRAQLDDDKTVRQNVSGENDTILFDGERRHVIGYLQEFLFSPERAQTRVGVLSGGERNRLLLAKLFTQPSNVLVMDEPTNDLDAETLDLLEEMLMNYPGTLLLVSHDRAFLNNVVTSTIAPLGNGLWNEYIGGYDDYLRQSKAQLKAAHMSTHVATGKSKTTNGATPNGTSSNGADVTSTTRPRKMSFKEKQELEALPARIEKWEDERQVLYEAMSDPNFYKGDAGAANVAQARLEAIESELTTAYEKWELLEALNAANA